MYVIADRLARLGRWLINWIQHVGVAGRLIGVVILSPGQNRDAFSALVKQLYSVGVLSLIIISVSGLFIGMVLGLQGYYVLSRYGSENAIGQMVALSLVRELGPVVSALLFAGRAGSALTAEIGLMKTTEQLSGLSMIGVDPLKHIVAPRFWAGVISLPLLSLIFNVVGIWGGAIVVIDWLGVFSGSFWSGIQESVKFFSDIGNGIIKSIVFAVVITWISVFQGYFVVPTSEGVGRATTRTVVFSSLAVLGLDFILTALMFLEI